MLGNILFILITTSYSFVFGDVYSTCYEYDTYCLFSFGPNVTVNNVKEAQKICEDAKHGSWLLEIVDVRVLRRVDEFISNHHFPEDTKLILNAGRVENNWKWIKKQTEVNTKLTDKILYVKNEKVYSVKSSHYDHSKSKEYYVVCMIGCPSKLKEYKNKRYIGAFHIPKKNEENCLELCESLKCEAWEWETGTNNGCWIHVTISGEMLNNPTGTLYAVDPFGKGYQKCTDGIIVPVSRDSKDYIGLYISLMILMIVALCVGLIIFWRRRKQKTEKQKHNLRKCVYSFPVIPGPIDEASPSLANSSPPHHLENEYSNIGNNNINNNGLIYADLSHLPRQNQSPKDQILGPLGDIYAQINR